MRPETRELLDVATRCAREGAAALLSVAPPTRVVEKTSGDYQTSADVAVEEVIRNLLRALRPNDTIEGEELGVLAGPSTARWYVDPLDGTRNFVQGRREVAVSVGVTVGGAPTAGAISLPYEGLLVGGALGLGVEVDGRPHKRSQAPVGVREPLIGLPSNGLRELLPALARAGDLSVRISGALAWDLAALALGRLDARFGGRFHPWDAIAGVSIVRAAGGEVYNGVGRRWAVGDRELVAVARLSVAHALRELGLYAGVE